MGRCDEGWDYPVLGGFQCGEDVGSQPRVVWCNMNLSWFVCLDSWPWVVLGHDNTWSQHVSWNNSLVFNLMLLTQNPMPLLQILWSLGLVLGPNHFHFPTQTLGPCRFCCFAGQEDGEFVPALLRTALQARSLWPGPRWEENAWKWDTWVLPASYRKKRSGREVVSLEGWWIIL